MSDCPPGLVGVPVRTWMWTASFESFMHLQLPAGTHVEVIAGSEPVPEKRDRLAELALEIPRWRWLLFLDSDQTFPPDVAQRLWRTSQEEHAGIVAAPSVRRSKQDATVLGDVNAWRLPEGFEPEDPERVCDDPRIPEAAKLVYADEIDREGEPFEVDLVGAGVTLIRREALEAVDGLPWFPPNRLNDPGRAEDTNFAYRAQCRGFRVMVDPAVRVGHVGPCPFMVEDVRRTLRPDSGDA